MFILYIFLLCCVKKNALATFNNDEIINNLVLTSEHLKNNFVLVYKYL